MDHCPVEKKIENNNKNNKKEIKMRRCCMVREESRGSPPYPIPEQETESLITMKLSSLVHMTNFIPAIIQTISRRVGVSHR